MNLYFGMGVLGLSLANNLLMLFLVPIVFLFVRVIHPPLVRNLGVVRFRGLAVFAAGAAISLAVASWGWYKLGFAIPEQQKSWLRFWDHMMLAWDQPLQESLIRFGSMLLLNFPPWSIVIGLIGLAELNRRQKYVFWLIFPLFLDLLRSRGDASSPGARSLLSPRVGVLLGRRGLRMVEAPFERKLAGVRGRARALRLSSGHLSLRPSRGPKGADGAPGRGASRRSQGASPRSPRVPVESGPPVSSPKRAHSREGARCAPRRCPGPRGLGGGGARWSRPSPTSSKSRSAGPRASWSWAMETKPASERFSPSQARSSRWDSILRIPR